MSLRILGATVAILGLAASGAMAQTQPASPGQGQNMAFCLEGVDGSKNCGFTTMAACEAAKKGQSDTCSRNAATTGSGGGLGTGGAGGGAGGTGGGMSR